MTVHAPRTAVVTHGRGPRYLARAALELVGATAVVWIALGWGAWWVTLVVGVVVGFTVRRTRRAWVVGVGAGLLGWGLPLAWRALGAPVGGAARDISSLMGYSVAGVALLVTLVVGGALGACGTWLGRAARAYRPSRHGSASSR